MIAKSKMPDLNYDKEKEYQSSAINMSDSIEQKSVYIYIENFLGDERAAKEQPLTDSDFSPRQLKRKSTSIGKNAINSMRYGMKHNHHHHGHGHCLLDNADDNGQILRFENNAEMDLTKAFNIVMPSVGDHV